MYRVSRKQEIFMCANSNKTSIPSIRIKKNFNHLFYLKELLTLYFENPNFSFKFNVFGTPCTLLYIQKVNYFHLHLFLLTRAEYTEDLLFFSKLSVKSLLSSQGLPVSTCIVNKFRLKLSPESEIIMVL